MLLTWLLKLFTSLIFFSNHCSKSIFSNGAVGYKLSHFCSIYIVKITHTSMYTKYNYIYMSTIEILNSYMSVYTNLPK